MRHFVSATLAYRPEANELSVYYWSEGSGMARHSVLYFTQQNADELLTQTEPPGHIDDLARIMLGGLKDVVEADMGWLAAMLHAVVRRHQLPGRAQ